MDNKKRLIIIFLLVLIQSMFILSVPYFIYLAFGMPKIAASHGMPVGNPFDFICIQSFVLFTSNLVPLPGASGGAELAFTMYFGKYFAIGNIRKIKPAILLWRFITYYGAIILTLPFSFYTKGRNKDEEYEKKLEAEEEKSEEELEIEEVVNRASDILYSYGTDQITSKQIGEAVLDVLAEVNEVAYVRFASVFREFKTLEDFEKILKEQKGRKASCE